MLRAWGTHGIWVSRWTGRELSQIPVKPWMTEGILPQLSEAEGSGNSAELLLAV